VWNGGGRTSLSPRASMAAAGGSCLDGGRCVERRRQEGAAWNGGGQDLFLPRALTTAAGASPGASCLV
jgi:hypothetical protein